ncbi:hypothetical protein [Thermomonospora umbrina]|uniref:hypothetical protein n=1 Tax=Thermomonospora umbrina TaxID=111806 RepID=UPI001B8696F8|nr:hypothetical protein [Thermomonospora umbrina]
MFRDQAPAAVWDGSVFTVTEFDRFARSMAEGGRLLPDVECAACAGYGWSGRCAECQTEHLGRAATDHRRD